ncbi:MAG: Acg family FMN-binding oxidoreductase [Gemmatimonadaceae bacterium]
MATVSSSEPLLASAVRHAVRAPSGHNAQPWRFRLHDDLLELWADRTRSLPVADPDDRELVISCGAALYTLRLAVLCHGRVPLVTRFPDPARPDLLAIVRLGGSHLPSAQEGELFDAVPMRRTVRSEFRRDPPPHPLVAALVQAAGVEGASFEVVGDDARAALAGLVARGDRTHGSDPRFRDELAQWVRAHEGAPDGMPAAALGMPGWLGPLNVLLARFAPWGRARAARDYRLALDAPLLAALCTSGDEPEDWLTAGEALQHVLLRATAGGLATAFLNQPVEIRPLREELGQLLQATGVAQLVLRFGYGTPTAQVGRRPLSDVLVRAGSDGNDNG